MRRGVLAFAIGVGRVIVAPIAVAADGLFEQSADVVQQRVLPLVDEDRRGRVERLQVNDAVLHLALADDLVDAVGDIDEFELLVRNQSAIRTKVLTPGVARCSTLKSDFLSLFGLGLAPALMGTDPPGENGYGPTSGACPNLSARLGTGSPKPGRPPNCTVLYQQAGPVPDGVRLKRNLEGEGGHRDRYGKQSVAPGPREIEQSVLFGSRARRARSW